MTALVRKYNYDIFCAAIAKIDINSIKRQKFKQNRLG